MGSVLPFYTFLYNNTIINCFICLSLFLFIGEISSEHILSNSVWMSLRVREKMIEHITQSRSVCMTASFRESKNCSDPDLALGRDFTQSNNTLLTQMMNY